MAGDDRTWRTRVEAEDGSRLVVVAPTAEAGRAAAVRAGGAVVVRWPTDLGLVTAEGILVSTETDVVDNWVVEVKRTAREQRRAAYRLPVTWRPRSGPRGDRASRPTPGPRTSARSASPARSCSPRPRRWAPRSRSPSRSRRGPLVARATVVRSEEVTERGDPERQFRLGLHLVDDDPHRREQLRRYVLDEQMRRLCNVD
jgi:hypothetical protein